MSETPPATQNLTTRPTISVIDCYRSGWRAFAKWWIPICMISAIIFGFNILPRLMISDDVNEISTSMRELIEYTADQNTVGMERAGFQIGQATTALGYKLLKWTAVAMPFVAVFTALLLIVANFAAKDEKEPLGLAYTLYLAGVNVILAFVRVVPFFLFIVPGIYIYVKLFFVSLVMIEYKCGAREAAVTSWRMTGGHNFWPLTILLMMNVGVNLVAGVTVVGLIPSVGFTNTAKAHAFQTLWKGSPEATLIAMHR